MKNFKKVLSLVLAVVMVMGSLVIAPMATNAESSYTKVTDVSTITSSGTEGKFFVVVAELDGKYYAMNAYSGNWVTATEITIVGGEITSTDVPVMKITGDASGLQFATQTGVTIYGELGGNKLYDTATDHVADWTVTEDGTDEFKFFLVGSDSTPRYFAYAGQNAKFRQYKETSLNDTYDATFMLYEYSGNVEVPQDIELEANATPEEIVNAAYEAMEKGVNLLGTWSLTGVVTAISDPYEGGSDYKNVALTIQVGDMTEKLIGGYRVTVADTTDEEALAMMQGLTVGDTVKLTGTIGYHGTTVQFVAGSLIELVEKASDAPQDITLPETATPEEIVAAAYEAMENGVSLLGTWKLTGVITAIGDKYEGGTDYKNASITIQVGDMTENPIGCYRLTVSDTTDEAALALLQGLAVGDTVTVEGTLGYYNTTVQFTQGCILKSVVKGENPAEDIELEADATEEEIVNAAYEAMENGVSLLGTWELTGVITEINTEYSDSYKNISVTIQVGNMTDKPIQCYRLTVADKDSEAALAILEGLEVGDEITAQGTFTYYNTTVEFAAGCVLLEVNGTPVTTQAPDTIDVISTGAGIVLVSGIALLAIVEMKKRR